MIDQSPEVSDGGFTLIEVLITTVILAIVIGTTSLMLVALITDQKVAANQISDSADAQLVSSYYDRDVAGAASVTTWTGASECGSGTLVLGLQYDGTAAGSYQSMVSYTVVTAGTTRLLERNYCPNGASSTPASTFVVSSDVPSTLASPTVSCNITCTPTTAWVPASSVTSVKFTITEPGSNYTYSLTSDPQAGLLPAGTITTSTNNTTCGFASAGTGTYASELCFVDFSSYNPSAAATGCSGNASADAISAAIANTPYTLSFCITQSGGLVVPYSIPTYTCPPTSEAFLGNNGFYTNIPGNPALYQNPGTTFTCTSQSSPNSEGLTSTVSLTNIQLTDSNGIVESGWDLTTGDAESTDSGESITWTSNQTMSLLPNSSTSQIGNACAAPTGSNPNNVALTGVGTTTVECSATTSSDKTGTVMLEAAAPTTLSATMVGSGLEAIFVGVLLP